MMSQFEIMDTEIFAKVEGGLGGWEEVAFQKIIWFGWNSWRKIRWLWYVCSWLPR